MGRANLDRGTRRQNGDLPSLRTQRRQSVVDAALLAGGLCPHDAWCCRWQSPRQPRISLRDLRQRLQD